VRVKIKNGVTDAAITGIGAVTIAGGQKVNLTVKDGSLASAGAVTQTVGDWMDEDGTALGSTFSEEVIVSDYALFYPSPTKVMIGSISMNINDIPKTFLDHSATFTQALVAGQHYTLVVDLRQLVFAGSNIWFNSNLDTLTFEEPGSTKTYQGMFFKWGSLVAISCYGLPDPAAIIIPPVQAGESWVTDKTLTTSPWGAGWGNIPHTIPPYDASATYPKDENYLYEHPDFANYRGDICAFLSGREGVPEGNWRMPNAEEFAVGKLVGGNAGGSTPNGGWGGVEVTAYMTLEFGSGQVRFPISGGRDMTGKLVNVIVLGSYWSGTPYSNHPANVRAYIANFTRATGTLNPYDHTTNAGAGAVRCVKA
jgi:hypothetical protein